MRSDDIPHATAEPSLRTGKIRQLTGLSDRQMHEWDKRGALPGLREGTGHRRATVWDVMALKMVSAIRRRYGIPLGSVAPVGRWMLGIERPDLIGAILASPATYEAKTPEECELALEIIRMAESEPRGNEAIDAIIACRKKAKSIGSRVLTERLDQVATGLVPLYGALGLMTQEFPVYLVTNLNHHLFASEPWLSEVVEAGGAIEDPIVMRVDGHINEVLRSIGGDGLPVTRRANEIQPVAGVSLEEQERIVLDTIRSRDFENVAISPNKHGLKIEITREHSIQDLDAASALIESQDYHSVLIKKRDGKFARVVQTTTHLVPGAANGKNPPRPGKKRSSSHA